LTDPADVSLAEMLLQSFQRAFDAFDELARLSAVCRRSTQQLNQIFYLIDLRRHPGRRFGFSWPLNNFKPEFISFSCGDTPQS
jgi:hypothetical protein